MAVSLTVQHLGREDLALAALHHDSHEAYTCDVPRPLKRLLDPGYSKITDGLDRAIATKLEVELPPKGTADGDLVKAADDAVLRIEAEILLHGGLAALGPGSEANGLDQQVKEAAQAGASERIGPGRRRRPPTTSDGCTTGSLAGRLDGRDELPTAQAGAS